jgi:hypothetical protein
LTEFLARQFLSHLIFGTLEIGEQGVDNQVYCGFIQALRMLRQIFFNHGCHLQVCRRRGQAEDVIIETVSRCGDETKKKP